MKLTVSLFFLTILSLGFYAWWLPFVSERGGW